MISIRRTAAHEVGHVIMSRVFEGLLKTNFVTIDPAHSRTIDAKSAGGFSVRPLKGDYTIIEHDQLFLIFLGGMSAEDLFNTNGVLPMIDLDYNLISRKLDMKQFDGDIGFMENQFGFLKEHIRISYHDYIKSALEFSYLILSKEEVWDAHKKLSHALLSSEDKRLNAEQINNVLCQTNLEEWVLINKKFLSSRHGLFG